MAGWLAGWFASGLVAMLFSVFWRELMVVALRTAKPRKIHWYWQQCQRLHLKERMVYRKNVHSRDTITKLQQWPPQVLLGYERQSTRTHGV